MRYTALCTVLAAAASVSPALAATLIDFEVGYTDNQELGDPEVLKDSAGNASFVTLSTANANTMSIEARGATDTDPDGFVTDSLGTFDTEVGGSLGDFFLRTTAALSGDLLTVNPVFTLSFDRGVRSVSGEIWDIDGTAPTRTEKWNVIVRDLLGNEITTLVSPEHGTNDANPDLDGQPWLFTYSGDTVGSLDFVFAGSKRSGIGVAFDNLTATPVPVPAAGVMLAGALAGFAAMRRRQSA